MPHPSAKRLVPELETLHSTMVYLGRYERAMSVNLERMFENALDYEHLPHLHESSFHSLSLIDKSTSHWRAEVRLNPSFLGLKQRVCLTLDKNVRVWVSEVEAGFASGVQIYTEAVSLGSQKIKVLVDFFVPQGKPLLRFMGPSLKKTYRSLYDEDEAMMRERQAQLDRVAQSEKGITHSNKGADLKNHWLGRAKDLRGPKPIIFHHQGFPYFLCRENNDWVARMARCPHMLASLEHCTVEKNTVTCAWHGYEFSLETGQCITHSQYKLPPGPPILEKDENVYVQPSQ